MNGFCGYRMDFMNIGIVNLEIERSSEAKIEK